MRLFPCIAIAILIAHSLVGCDWFRSSESEEVKLSGVAGIADDFDLDGETVASDFRRLTREPHPFGSQSQEQIAQWLVRRLKTMGINGNAERFSAEVPRKMGSQSFGPERMSVDLTGYNVFANLFPRKQACIVLIGSHYDTKALDHVRYVGANDSGSSSVLLLQLARYLRAKGNSLALRCSIGLVWFDGEEAVLAGWHDSERFHPSKLVDHTYGSREFVQRLSVCGSKKRCLNNTKVEVSALILLDMVGMPNIKLTNDIQSTQALRHLLKVGAHKLGLSHVLSDVPKLIEDDHQSFLEVGIPAINLIDFEHLSTWHNGRDQVKTLSKASMKKAGQLAIWLALSVATSPKLAGPR